MTKFILAMLVALPLVASANETNTAATSEDAAPKAATVAKKNKGAKAKAKKKAAAPAAAPAEAPAEQPAQ